MTDSPVGRANRLTVVFAALSVVMTIVAVVLFAMYKSASDDRAVTDAGEAARSAACLYATGLVSFDYRSLDAYFSRMTDGATGEWKSNFVSTIDATRDSVSQNRTVSSTGDVQCGLVTGDENSATVVIVAAQSIVSGDPPGAPQSGQVYMVALMKNDGGRWLCSKLVTSLHGA